MSHHPLRVEEHSSSGVPIRWVRLFAMGSITSREERKPKNSQKPAFKKHRKGFGKLTSLSYLFGLKGPFLNQKSAPLPIIAVLLSTSLTAVGSSLFGAK